MVPTLFALSLAAAAPLPHAPSTAAPPGSPNPAAASEGTLLSDPAREVEVRYAFRGDMVVLFSELPAEWSFGVAVDGDQDGTWGSGTGLPPAARRTSADWSYGQDSRGHVFCAQYVLTAAADDPASVYASTDCDAFPSRGSVRLGQLTARTRATISYEIPADELFGGRPTAHLRVCVWDTQRDSCKYSPADPFVLVRPKG